MWLIGLSVVLFRGYERSGPWAEPPWGSLSLSTAPLFSLAPPGQFLLEESRLLEAAEMAEKAARLDGGEFDVVFSAAHMLRWVSGFSSLKPDDSRCCSPGRHWTFFVAEEDEPEFSMAEQKRGSIKEREFFFFYIPPQPIWFTQLYFVILFPRCSTNLASIGLSYRPFLLILHWPRWSATNSELALLSCLVSAHTMILNLEIEVYVPASSLNKAAGLWSSTLNLPGKLKLAFKPTAADRR